MGDDLLQTFSPFMCIIFIFCSRQISRMLPNNYGKSQNKEKYKSGNLYKKNSTIWGKHSNLKNSELEKDL